METKANYVAVGAFVLICVIGLVVAVLWLAQYQYGAEKPTSYKTFFAGPVTGLGNGTIVRYNGIDIGKVTAVNFDPADPKQVVAILGLDPKLQLHTDSVATIESQGLTGGIYVEITGGSKDTPFLTAKPGEDMPVIMSKPSAIQQLYDTLPQLMDRLNTLADRGGDILNDANRKALSDTLNNIRDLTGNFAQHSAEIDAAIAGVAPALKQLNTTLASADVAAKNVATLGADASDAIKRVNTLTADIDDAVKKGPLSQLDALLIKAQGLVTSLTRLSDDLQRQPTKLIFGDRRQGYTPQ